VESFSFNSTGDIFACTWWYPADTLVVDRARYRLERSTDNGITWTSILESWGSLCTAINKDDHIFVGTFGKVQRSTDNGKTWETVNDKLEAGFIHALAISPEGFIYLGANGGNYRSTDGGYHWTKLDLKFQAMDFVFREGGQIFAGVNSGYFPEPAHHLYRSSDNGETWERVLTTEKTYGWSMAVNKKGYIFAATNGYEGSCGGVYRSRDNGDTWIRMNNGLPNSNVDHLVINSQDHIFVGIYGSGVYHSTDDGENWTAVNNGLSDLRVTALGISPHDHVFVGSGTNSTPTNSSEIGHVFRSTTTTSVNDDGSDIPNNFILGQNYPNPFNSTTAVQFSIPHTGHVSVRIYNILGQEVSTLFSGRLSSGNHEIHWNPHNLAGGVYFCHLQLDNLNSSIKMTLLP